MAKTRKHDRERGPGSHDDRDLSLQAESSTRRGPLTLTSTMVRARLSRALDEAARGRDVVITRRGIPQGVLVAAARYRELLAEEMRGANAGRALADSEYARMQTPAVRAGTARGINATPAEMGRAAVRAARRFRDSNHRN